MGGVLEEAIFFRKDLSFLGSNRILSLIPPTKLMQITLRIRKELSDLSDQVSAICDEPDLDIDPSDNFQEFTSYLALLREFFCYDEEAIDSIAEIEGEVEGATDEIKRKKFERERARRRALEEADEEWSDRVSSGPVGNSARSPFAEQSHGKPRSIFSDVDE
jgi:hypothetical protein